jgi:hypothetical protein
MQISFIQISFLFFEVDFIFENLKIAFIFFIELSLKNITIFLVQYFLALIF